MESNKKPNAARLDIGISLQPFWPYTRKNLKLFSYKGQKLFSTYEVFALQPNIQTKSVPGSLITGFNIPLTDEASTAVVAGPITEMTDVVFSPAKHTFGCHLYPGVFSAIFGIPTSELTPAGTNMVDVLNCREYVEKIQMSKSQHERENLTVQFIRRAIEKHTPAKGERLALYIGSIVQENLDEETIRLKLDEIGICDRHLRRLMCANIGVAPKTATCSIRLQCAMHLLLETDLTLAEIALECGYYDQPHMNNDFKARIGYTPEEFRKNFGYEKADAE